MSITYECVLLGTFDSSLLDKVRDKLRVICDANGDLHCHEKVMSVQAGPNTTNGRMVMRREGIDETDESAKWCVCVKWRRVCNSYKPPGLLCVFSELNQRHSRTFPTNAQKSRYNPQLLIRSTINLPLDTNHNAVEFVQALGYNPNHEFSKRGDTYMCNGVIVGVYQLHNVGVNGERVHEDNVWMVEVRSLPVVPDQSAVADPLNVAMHNCLKLKATLKPLVLLKRVEH
ncbi:hypothetical protein E3P92_03046 [Wallemia ichthyophaga]|uniref:Mediator of RNA polymerase II transcription subunit 18 n=1 Tax=Wallemia ichthyophaga TaxID=245174 RepID=A0A4T0FYA0_WALIC|nr:hypothetical protein E3P91_02639 [Wallemia ichthyophaga]TIA94007.1 hypothetical protein E3P97_00587 [Wallemia ichthyophaga]TIB06216.1 hypothetical protein E3P96_00672 [Wallemia ichthyophaga]TIB09926.1 hypothetical protein E3P93_03065 [Wallemia ichthyophaga]TIB09995.1 hypothetical protein E3P90_03061 [Wallemia ichthyophaga]